MENVKMTNEKLIKERIKSRITNDKVPTIFGNSIKWPSALSFEIDEKCLNVKVEKGKFDIEEVAWCIWLKEMIGNIEAINVTSKDKDYSGIFWLPQKVKEYFNFIKYPEVKNSRVGEKMRNSNGKAKLSSLSKWIVKNRALSRLLDLRFRTENDVYVYYNGNKLLVWNMDGTYVLGPSAKKENQEDGKTNEFSDLSPLLNEHMKEMDKFFHKDNGSWAPRDRNNKKWIECEGVFESEIIYQLLYHDTKIIPIDRQWRYSYMKKQLDILALDITEAPRAIPVLIEVKLAKGKNGTIEGQVPLQLARYYEYMVTTEDEDWHKKLEEEMKKQYNLQKELNIVSYKIPEIQEIDFAKTKTLIAIAGLKKPLYSKRIDLLINILPKNMAVKKWWNEKWDGINNHITEKDIFEMVKMVNHQL